MFHDAPVEAAVVVHRNRHRHRLNAGAAATAADAPTRRVVEGYQLHRVADFLLSGALLGGSAAAPASPSASSSSPCCAGSSSAPAHCGCAQSSAASTDVSSAGPYMRVALQFPDDLLGDAVAVVHCLSSIVAEDPRYVSAMGAKKAAAATVASLSEGRTISAANGTTPASRIAAQVRPAAMDNPHSPTTAMRLFVLADNTFGSCCPDEITAQHYTADCIVHFGNACMSRSTRLPVFYVQPTFHLDALADTVAAPASSGSVTLTGAASAAVTSAEATAVLEVVACLVTAIRERCTRWWREQAQEVAPGTAACPLRPRLLVVGTYPTKTIMHAAQRRWTDTHTDNDEEGATAAAVRVDWPHYEERSLPTGAVAAASPAPDTASPSPSAAGMQSPFTDADSWLVNGVRFPRLPSPSPSSAAQAEVHYLLFVGPADSSALVHVMAAEQYNQFHYSDPCRSFLEWEDNSDGDASVVPVVSVMDNTFGATATEVSALPGLVQRAAAETNADASDASQELTAAVKRWVTEVCVDGVAAALTTGHCVKAQLGLQRRVRQRAFNIESVRASTAIGILVASLAIEGYYEVTQELHKLIRAYGKRSYVIYVGHLNEFKLANFADTVDCFVAVACPYSRQSHFPEKKDGFMKPIVSPAELLVALTSVDDTEADEQYGMAAVYTTSFGTVLHALTDAVQARRRELEGAAAESDSKARQEKEEARWACSGTLVRTGAGGNGGGGALTVHGSSQGSLARLNEREYVGLDPRIGQTPVQTAVLDGKHGIARGYAKEREEQGSSQNPLRKVPQKSSSRPADRSITFMSTSGSPQRRAPSADVALPNLPPRLYTAGSSDTHAHSQRVASSLTSRTLSSGASRAQTVQPNRHSSRSRSRTSSQPQHSSRQRHRSHSSLRARHRHNDTPPLPPWRYQSSSQSTHGHSSRMHHSSSHNRSRSSSASRRTTRGTQCASPQKRSEPSRPANGSRAGSPSTPGTRMTTATTTHTRPRTEKRPPVVQANQRPPHPAPLIDPAVSATSTSVAAASAANHPSGSVNVSRSLVSVSDRLREGPHGVSQSSALGASNTLNMTASRVTAGHRFLSPDKTVSSAVLPWRNQCYCSHCKLAEEVLYGCPCGLARYCSTTCQRAHWPLHKTVCSCAVRAVRPPTRRCDWCHTSSQTLRQCGCGYAYYCDTQCQRADWSSHCTTCSTVTSQALATALVGRDAPLRGRREAATQTAHWQISVPVVDSASWASLSPRDRHSRSGSEELMDFLGSPSESAFAIAGDFAAVPTSAPHSSPASRHRSRHREVSEHESQFCDHSGSCTLNQSRATGHGVTGHHADPSARTPLSTLVASEAASSGGGVSPPYHGASAVHPASRSRRSRHHTTGGSLYNSLHINGAPSHHSARTNPASENSTFATSQSLRFSQAPLSHVSGVPGTPMSSHRHHHSLHLDGAGAYSGDGEGGERPGASKSAPMVRDQPGMMVFLVASRNIIERDEIKARAALFTAFLQAGVQLQMAVLNKLEEEDRMSIIREEVRWFVVTGQPGWRKLRQELQCYLQSRK